MITYVLNENFSGQGIIQELDLTNHNDSHCFGYDVYIVLIQEEKNCTTSTKKDFNKGAKFSWTGAELGSCVDIPFFYDDRDEINFKIRSTAGDQFCPNSFTITMKDGKKYENHGMYHGMDDIVNIKEGKKLRTAKILEN